ncbi:MAG: VCBS repeat-containing protein, partial [Planctomycetota bacterium]|nr:VCBS repeat-containing protein [Planctomycetota bacterium]
MLAAKWAFDQSLGYTGALNVATADVDGNGTAEVIVSNAAAFADGRSAEVRVFDALSGNLVTSFTAFAGNSAGNAGVRLAAGDVDGDGDAEVIVGLPDGKLPAVRVYDPFSGAVKAAWYAYSESNPSDFLYGVYVASGDTDGDGKDEVIVGPGGGGNPKIRIFNAEVAQPSSPTEFSVWSAGWTGAVPVGAFDGDSDGDTDVVVGLGPGSEPAWRVYNGQTGAVIRGGLTHSRGFRGGISVASGSMAFDRPAPLPSYVAGQSSGGTSLVTVVDAVTNAARFQIDPYANYDGLVRVAFGDVTGDGIADVVVAPGSGSVGSLVRIFDGRDGTFLREFYAYDPTRQGGISVAVGDGDGDDICEIITSPEGSGPYVRVYDGKQSAATPNGDGSTGLLRYALTTHDSSLTGTFTPAVADVNGDGEDDIIVAPGAGNAPDVRVFDGRTRQQIHQFFAYAPTSTAGVRVAAGDVDGDGKADIVTAAIGGGPYARVFDGLETAQSAGADGSTGLLK